MDNNELGAFIVIVYAVVIAFGIIFASEDDEE